MERSQLLSLLEDFGDLHVVAGGARLAASRLLLAAAAPALRERLREREPRELRLDVAPEVAKAIVAHSCGAPLAHLDPEQRRTARHVLHGVAVKGCAAQAAERNNLLSWVIMFSLLCAAMAAYWRIRDFNLETGGFFMDDVMIRKNAVVVENPMDWQRLWRTDYWGLEMFDPNTWTHKSFRPFTVLTFRWNYLLHGFGNCGFHLTNVILHGICSLQLALFGRAIHLPMRWATLLACLFAVHPIHTESICYVVGRADILCAQAVLLAAHLNLGRSLWRLLMSCGLVVVSGLLKETGFTFFGLLVVWEVLQLIRTRSCRAWRAWLRIALVLVLGSAACAARVWYTAGTKIARMDPHSNPIAAEEDPYVRALSYSLVHGMYVKLLLWPVFLCYDYSMDAVPLVQSLVDVRLLLPLAAYSGIALSACMALRRDAAILGLAIFILSFLPMTNILFPIGTLVAERLLYIPSMGFLLAGVSFAREVSRGWWVVAVIVAWWYLCQQRVGDWQSVERITLVDGLKQLKSSRTQFNLANLYLQSQRLDEALVAYQRAVAADPLERDAQPLYHAGQILMYQGKYAEAEVYLHKAVTGYFSPLTLHEEEVWHDYGLALWHVGRHMEAAHNFQNAIITNPNFPKGHNNLACALVMLGLSNNQLALVQQGLQAMEQALALAPQALYWRNAAVLLNLAGEQSAAAAWERYRQIDPKAAAAEELQGIPRDCTWEFYFR